MTEASHSAFDSARPALTDAERDQLIHAVRRCARQQGLSPSVTDRYQAWIFVFASWCHRHPPHRIDQNRIGAFREALQQSADAGDEEVNQAMDALGFLFGAADEVTALLASRDATPEDGDAAASPSESGSRSGAEDGLQTLQVGWQSGSEASDDSIRAPQIPLERAPNAPLSDATDADEEETEKIEESSSTAKLCIKRFQTQVESLHAPDADAAEPPEQESDPEGQAEPEPTPSS